MRLWWPWRKWATLGSGTDPSGRLVDGDVVLAPGQQRWTDLLDGYSTASDSQVSRAALTEPTQFLPSDRPLMTPGQQWRSRGSRP